MIMLTNIIFRQNDRFDEYVIFIYIFYLSFQTWIIGLR